MEQRLYGQSGSAGPRFVARSTGDLVALLLALAIAAAFVVVLLQWVDFPLRLGRDEPIKAKQVLHGQYNYHHPLLMLELARAANAVVGVTDLQAVVELGRAVAVLAGALAVVATFLLARKVVPAPVALAASLATSVIPAITVHARYFKEDIFALPFILLSLVALIETLRAPTRMRALLLGTAIGFAASAKFSAAIVLPFAAAVLLLDTSGKENWQTRLRLVGLTTLVAIALLALVELPAIWNFAAFRSSLIHNLYRVRGGDEIPLPVTLTYGIFHLRESLLPSLGAPLLIMGLFGLATPWFAPPRRRQPLLVIVLFVLLWYAVHELSPLKPYPNFQRYMVPVVPLLVILGAAFIYELAEWRFPAWGTLIAPVVLVAGAAPALYASLRIAGPPVVDPRSIVASVIVQDTPSAAFDRYTRLDTSRASANAAKPNSIFVTSSFAYERFTHVRGTNLGPGKRAKAAAYTAMFKLPYLQVSNGRPTYGWFNPVLRIIALDGDTDHLKSIAAALTAAAPDLSVRVANGGGQGSNEIDHAK